MFILCQLHAGLTLTVSGHDLDADADPNEAPGGTRSAHGATENHPRTTLDPLRSSRGPPKDPKSRYSKSPILL
jgi:hypothetical protein